MPNQPKHLKKNDFLAAVTEAPMTRGQLVEALEDFEFIGTYLDYLTEHFEAQGKIVVTEGEIAGSKMIARKGKKTGGPRNVFRVLTEVAERLDQTTAHTLESKEITGNLSDVDKEAGWSMTEKAAIKKACSDVFADYKAQTAAIKLLVVEDDTAEDEHGDEAA